MGVTPSHHPFIAGIFHYKASSYGGFSMYGNPYIPDRMSPDSRWQSSTVKRLTRLLPVVVPAQNHQLSWESPDSLRRDIYGKHMGTMMLSSSLDDSTKGLMWRLRKSSAGIMCGLPQGTKVFTHILDAICIVRSRSTNLFTHQKNPGISRYYHHPKCHKNPGISRYYHKIGCKIQVFPGLPRSHLPPLGCPKRRSNELPSSRILGGSPHFSWENHHMCG